MADFMSDSPPAPDDGNPFGLDEPEADAVPAAPAAFDASLFTSEGGVDELTNGAAAAEPTDGTGVAGTTVAQMNEESGITDAREEWRGENAVVLKERDESETKANVDIETKAQAYMANFYEERSKMLASAKERNREQQEAASAKPVGEVPWERVMSMIDFKFDAGRQKETERERFKSLLFLAKDKNVPVSSTPIAA